jgi:hypothetical protein
VACDGSPTGTVTIIDANGNRTEQSPCFDFTTLPDLLEAAGISWNYSIDGDGIFAVIRYIRNSPCGRRIGPQPRNFFRMHTGGHYQR